MAMKKALIFLACFVTTISSFGKNIKKPLNLNKILINPEKIEPGINNTMARIQELTKAPEEWITIFVHGSVGSSLCLRHFLTLFKESITGTAYEKETLEHRNGPQWHKNQAAQGLGLHKIDMDGPIKDSAQLFAHIYDDMQKKAYPQHITTDYYTFGWSGIVNHKERCKDAERMYNELKTLVTSLKKEHKQKKIRIVTYSHGGNMVCNMIDVHNRDKDALDITINELIMIATPIQRETDCNVLNPLFENVYSIYSRADCVQKMDCFSFIRFFSGRKFKDSCRCEIGNVVQQIELKITVAAQADAKLACSTCRPSKKRIDRSPGHVEFWHFADLCFCQCDNEYEPCFESKLYRAYFPFEPLPAAVFTPLVIAAAQKNLPYQHAVVELQPDTGHMVLRKKHTRKKQTIDFMSPDEIKELRNRAMPFLQKELTDDHTNSKAA